MNHEKVAPINFGQVEATPGGVRRQESLCERKDAKITKEKEGKGLGENCGLSRKRLTQPR